MAYEPKTAEGKQALTDGADPKVVEGMEEDGTFATPIEEKKPEHVDKPGDQQPAEDELDENGQPKKPTVDRPVETSTIPEWKRKEELKKAREEGEEAGRTTATAEFEQKLQEAGGKKDGATQEDVEKIAEEFSMKPEVVSAFIERLGGVVAKSIKPAESVGLSSEDRAVLDGAAEREKAAKEQEGFDKEFSDPSTTAALTEASGGKEVTAEVRARVRQLAYTDTYHRYRLADIIRLEASKLFPTGETTAEVGRGGAGQGKGAAKSIDDLTPDEILNMPADEFKALSDRLGGGQSRFTRTVVPKKNKKAE